MTIPYFEVSAFSQNPFGGNPAGVCLLDAWLDDAAMHCIAANNNLSETAFLVENQDAHDLRWFTPAVEVDLCGHATLAAAAVIVAERNAANRTVRFNSRSGLLTVAPDGDRFVMDFPSQPAAPCDTLQELVRALRAQPTRVLRGRNLMAVFDSEASVRALHPDFAAMKGLDCPGVIATAPGTNCDFVSRYFAPAVGIDEDPVTGSAHCMLIPYWADRLKKRRLHARQISKRGGELFCELSGERVRIGGYAVIYLRGNIEIGPRSQIR